jgi:DNA-binding LacI/PurR family transcriptional regulator
MDVAKVAGVSRSTASVALGGNGRVSDATRVRVTSAAERLGYVANPAARHLRQGKLGILGLYLPHQVFSLAYYMDIVLAAAEQARNSGYALTLLVPSTTGRRPLDVPVDGLIAIDPLASDPTVRELLESGLPVATGERYLGEGRRPMAVVESDHEAGMVQLLEHVMEVGARSPALIVPGDESSWAGALRRSYRAWCHQHGIRERIRDIAFGASPDAVRGAATSMLAEEPPPDAIISAPDGGAIGVLGAASDAGRRVGEDLLIATCVDSVVMQLASPAITALDLRPRVFARTCVKTLVQALENEPTPATTMHPIELVRRASTGG